MIPDNWQRALERRRAHFHIADSTTLRLVHDEDDRIRIDRFGHVCWFYCYQAPSPADLDAMEAFALAANSPHWCAQLMQQRGQDPHSRQQVHSDMPDEWTAEEEGLRYYLRRNQSLSPGLFLDQRANRRWLRDRSTDRSVLNLFSYTGAATVHAGLGGAETTTSVDMSKTYLDWARRNLELNGLADGRHELVQADCIDWVRGQRGARYDLIFLDPPTFSNSKRMQDHFDVQRDHVGLLQAVSSLLSEEGVLIFSNNFRRFKMDTESLPTLSIEDITARTIDKDFERNARIHTCWKIVRKPLG